MDLTAIKQDIITILEEGVDKAESEIITYATPAVTFLKANGGAAMLTLAESVLAGFTAGGSWATIIAAFIPAAKAAGVTLSEGAASAVLNFAQANAQAKQLAASAPVANTATS